MSGRTSAKLLCETNTPKVDRILQGAWQDSSEAKAHNDAGFSTDFEHGQWWVSCMECGALWSANDCTPGVFAFEQVTDGDEDAHQAD